MIEFVIGLVLVSLIVLGVIKGQALIENVKLNQLIQEFELYENATNTYIATHRRAPGAYQTVNAFGGIDNYWEESRFWKDLRKEGLIEGDPNDGSSPPEHVFGNPTNRPTWRILRFDPIFLICAEGLKDEYADLIENKFNDGGDTSYKAGKVYIYAQYVCKEMLVGKGG